MNDLLPENIHLRDNIVIPAINEILRRHDHNADAHILDARLFTDLIEAEASRRELEARIDEQRRTDGAYLRFLKYEGIEGGEESIWLQHDKRIEALTAQLEALKD